MVASSWTPASQALPVDREAIKVGNMKCQSLGLRMQLPVHLCKTSPPPVRAALIRSQIGDGRVAGRHEQLLSSTLPHLHSVLKDTAANSMQMLTTAVKDSKSTIVGAIVDLLFKDSREANMEFQGNFGPVDEIGFPTPLEVIEGAIPFDFPTGVYIRSGPNPQFGGKIKISPFGRLNYHWFEGDGMLHATYFGQDGEISYDNKYVHTDAYVEETMQGKSLWLSNLGGDQRALLMAYFFNQLRFDKAVKETCNTSVFVHNGRLFATSDSSRAIEISPHNLESIGHWDVAKEWGRPFGSHAKTLPKTGEMVVFGFSAMKPYYKLGVISADGTRLVHTCDMEFETPMYSHDLAITENFDIILDMPLSIDLERAMQGGQLLKFDENGISRFGIKPRLGDATTIRWFPVDLHYTFHIVNSYEDGNEVIVHGCRARRSIISSPPHSMTKIEWFSRGIDETLVSKDLRDPNVDGALFATIHEWKFNLLTGLVSERDLTSGQSAMDMPQFNKAYTGLKYKYAYAAELNHEASKQIGMPKYGRLVKLTILEKDSTVEFYGAGEDMFFSEPLFVPRPNSCAEDDGWIVTYAHDERSEVSEVHILNAQTFSEPAVARIKLPQRVPYGFHSTFMPGLF